MTSAVVLVFGVVAVAVYFLTSFVLGKDAKRYPVVPVAAAAVTMVAGFFLASTFVIVPFGQVEIVTFNGALTDRILQPGLNFKWPLINGVYGVNTQMRALRVNDDQVFTRDQQNANNNYVINFTLNNAKIVDIVKQFRGDGGWDTSIEQRLIEPRASYWLKQIEPRYNAADLIQNRAKVATELQNDLDRDLRPYGVEIAFTSLTNITYGPEYQKASEERAAAEQEYQRELTVLKTKQVIAQQEVALADGDRKAEELRRKGLGNDPHIAADLVSLAFLERMTKDNGWDGRVPQVLGGNALLSVDGSVTSKQ